MGYKPGVLDQETALLVREVTKTIGDAHPDRIRRALCDILGVIIEHVMSGKVTEEEREPMLRVMLDMVEWDILKSYDDFRNSPEKRGH